jgi:cytochrome c-type biogenesis protein
MFGIDIFDAGLLPALLIAVAAGVLSFLSPCVLPIVPPYIAYMSGIGLAEAERRRARTLTAALFFVLGLSTVFLFLGFTASWIGRLFLEHQLWLSRIAGGVILIFGLHFLGVFRLPLLNYDARFDAGDRGGSAFGAYILGLAFAFGWTPCIGPILGAILGLAASEASLARGTFLLGAYAVGLGLPFLLVAAFLGRATGLLARLRRHMGLIEKLMGLLLVAVGIAMMTGAFSAFSWWLLETFPGLAALG